MTLRGLFLQFLTFFSSVKVRLLHLSSKFAHPIQVEQEYGGSIYIGEKIISEYAREDDIQSLFTAISGQSDYDHSSGYYSPWPFNSDMERAWNSDNRPEIVVCNYQTSKGLVVHKIKSTRPSPSRVHKIDYQNPKWAKTLQLISTFRCKSCPYGSDALPHHGPIKIDPTDVHTLSPPTSCPLEMLDDDILYTLAEHLPSESLITFSQAYLRFHTIIESSHELLRRELTCFFLRTSLGDSVLGIGIHLDYSSRALSSDFDWLSEAAFEHHHIRKSIQKRPFEYFLPLAFSPAHFERVLPIIWTRLAELDRGITAAWSELSKRTGRSYHRRLSPPKQVHQTVDVLYQMMNNIVVALMKSCDDVLESSARHHNHTLLHASEKAVYSYCHLFHLLISLTRSDTNIVSDAKSRIGAFRSNSLNRDKKHVPDLGEFIVVVTLVLALSSTESASLWSSLNGPFLEEAFIRNVRWILQAAPDLEVMERGRNDYRLYMTFSHSKTSLRLIMFQITFLYMFVESYSSDMARLDANYGFAEKDFPEHMVEEIKLIYKVQAWPDFFDRVKYSRGRALGAEKFSDMLRAVVKTSASRGYHTPSSKRHLGHLAAQRKTLEQKWVSGNK